MNKTIIKTKNLKRTYKTGSVETKALKDISIDVKEKEFVAIMGPSGSGKSTLLHQLGLIDHPTEGSIEIENEDVINIPEKKKTRFRLEKLGYVFQNSNLIPELTALENVYLTEMARGVDENYVEKAKEMLGKVGLGERMGHYPSELSGGEQQRVSIARALVNNPKILFADEPTANLDTDTSNEIIKLFRKLNKEINQTIIMVSHEPNEGKKADRIIWIKDGLLDKEKNKNGN